MAFTKENHLMPVNFDVPTLEAQVIDVAGPLPSNIVHASDVAAGNVKLRIKWSQTGLIPQFGGFNPSNHYHPRVFLEQMGPGEGPNVPSAPFIPVKQGNKAENYEVDITLPKMGAGVYKCVITLNFWVLGHAWAIFHAFDEVTLIEVVDA